jgi:6-phospho-3-hexuloisomerase
MTRTTGNNPDPDLTDTIGRTYLQYLDRCLIALETQNNRINELLSLIRTAKNIHVFGFGRSGTAALAFAIRLRHFSAYLPPVWWIGDQVREPIREQDLVILFSQSGTRKEVVLVAEKAEKAGAVIALVTAEKDSAIAELATLTILLPRLDEVFVYGSGDFELAAWYLQEVLVSLLGTRLKIPPREVNRNHV